MIPLIGSDLWDILLDDEGRDMAEGLHNRHVHTTSNPELLKRETWEAAGVRMPDEVILLDDEENDDDEA